MLDFLLIIKIPMMPMKTILFLAGVAASVVVNAAPTKPFSCEMIKEKTARASCIESRTQKTEQEKVVADKIALEKAENDKKVAEEAEKARAKAEVDKRMSEFVTRVKDLIGSSLKDPDSANYIDLKILTGMDGKRTLCGKVNAKNSYGGYTGRSAFYFTEEPVKTQFYLESKIDSKDPMVLIERMSGGTAYLDLCLINSQKRAVQVVESKGN